MRKFIIIFIIGFLFLPLSIFATTKNVDFASCIDGDTAKFKDGTNIIKVRFLAIDTPESTNEIEPYGKDASNYTCQKLQKATTISLEFDVNSAEKDKYDRYLAWVFVDNVLLQKDIVRNGYGEVAYLYGNYKYTKELQSAQKEAQKENLRIWSDYKETTNYLWLYITFIILIMFYVFSEKYRQKINKIILSIIKKIIKKDLGTIA